MGRLAKALLALLEAGPSHGQPVMASWPAYTKARAEARKALLAYTDEEAP
jgi:hypothetical protein